MVGRVVQPGWGQKAVRKGTWSGKRVLPRGAGEGVVGFGLSALFLRVGGESVDDCRGRGGMEKVVRVAHFCPWQLVIHEMWL